MRAKHYVPAVLVPLSMIPGLLQAAEPQLSGFMDTIYTLSDGTQDPDDSPTAQTWDVTAELDYKLDLAKDVSGRMDLDFNLAGNTGYGAADSGKMEQAFVSWQTSKELRVTGGVFNNPLGWEVEDAPDMYQISHGQIYDIFDGETALYGNNVAGVAVSGVVGPLVVTGALLNDLGGVAEKTSFAAIANYKPIKELDTEFGIMTEDGGAERLIDINVTYNQALFVVGAEVLIASAIYDNALGLTGNYEVNDQLSATLRYDTVSYEASGVDNTSTITMAALYMLEKNIGLNFEIRLQNDPNDPDDPALVDPATGQTFNGIIGDGDVIAMEFLANF